MPTAYELFVVLEFILISIKSGYCNGQNNVNTAKIFKVCFDYCTIIAESVKVVI